MTAFISYRRDDCAAEARLVADALRRVLPFESVFIDSGAIQSGETWPDRIGAVLADSTYVLVMIGPAWLTAGANEWGQRRIDNATDWVRREISSALNDRRKVVIPLLVRGARMPPAEALPSDVAAITTRQAIEIRRDYWDHDVSLVTARVFPNESAEIRRAAAPSPLVANFWDDLSPSLQDALVLAATSARRAGKNVISTRTLFAALRRLDPDPLREFFEQVPPDSLPEALPEGLIPDISAFAEIEAFSGCVSDSLDRLASHADLSESVSAEAVFVDIARNGTGESVRRLRTHGVDAERVDEIVRELGWTNQEAT